VPRDRGSHGAVRLCSDALLPGPAGRSLSEPKALYPSRTCSRTF